MNSIAFFQDLKLQRDVTKSSSEKLSACEAKKIRVLKEKYLNIAECCISCLIIVINGMVLFLNT